MTKSAEISYNNTMNSMKDSKAILLQTVKAVACDPSEVNKAGVRILFDNGSQRSYITDSLKQRLRLSVSKNREKLYLNTCTFGDDRFKSRQCEVVNFKLTRQGMEKPVLFKAFNFPTICTSLPPMIKLDNYLCLNDLELADYLTNQSTTIDVQITIDTYDWRSVKNQWRAYTSEWQVGVVAVRDNTGIP